MRYLSVFSAVYQQCANWKRLLLNKLLGIPVSEIRLRDGIKFATVNGQLGGADLSMLVEIWQHEYYNPPFFAIGPKDIVFDVGANNGYFTLYAAQAVTGGKVYAFEPVPSLAGLIATNAKNNNLQNVIVESLALAGKDGQSDFFVSPSHNGCHSLFRRSRDDAVIKVRTRTLESYCAEHAIEHIDFLKLDCEGAEYEIIFSLSQAFLNRVSKISMELHDSITNHTHKEIEDFLRARGFFVTVKHWYLYALNRQDILLSDPKNNINSVQ